MHVFAREQRKSRRSHHRASVRCQIDRPFFYTYSLTVSGEIAERLSFRDAKISWNTARVKGSIIRRTMRRKKKERTADIPVHRFTRKSSAWRREEENLGAQAGLYSYLIARPQTRMYEGGEASFSRFVYALLVSRVYISPARITRFIYIAAYRLFSARV